MYEESFREIAEDLNSRITQLARKYRVNLEDYKELSDEERRSERVA
jgi:hypothetical protein